MNWYVFFGVLFGWPALLAALYVFAVAVDFIEEYLPSWVGWGLFLLFIAAVFGVVTAQ